MAKSELQKLGRAQLLQLLLEVEEENEALKQQVADLEKQLSDRRIRIEKSGNLAKAALELNGVFASAQAACEQYVENIKLQHASAEARIRQMEQEAAEKCRAMEEETAEKCKKALQDHE